jgi:tetratricopeptide (TPR) repeat protein
VLEYLVNTGILGLAAYLGIFVAAFYTIFRISGVNFAKPIFAALLIAYFVQNLFLFDTIGTYLMFFLALGFLSSQSRTDRDLTRTAAGISQGPNKSAFSITIVFLLLLSFIPVYYNYQILKASQYQYHGVNYFLNQQLEKSLYFFNQALKTPTPYLDDIRRDFANAVEQAYEQGIQYPNLSELQNQLVEELNLVIKRHPQDYLHYITLANFKQTFYAFNPNYIQDSETLSRQALILSPKRQQTYYVIARSRLLAGDVEGAYNIFREAVELNPEAGDPHFFFGLMAYALGDVQTARTEIAKAEALSRFPKDVKEAVALANFLGDYERNYKKAIDWYNWAYSASSDDFTRANILLKLGVAYYFDANKEKARESFNKLKESKLKIDFKMLPIYPELRPILEELEIE